MKKDRWYDIHNDAIQDMYYPDGVDIERLIDTLIDIKNEHQGKVFIRGQHAYDYNRGQDSYDYSFVYIKLGDENEI
jgi:hypothetical protein